MHSSKALPITDETRVAAYYGTFFMSVGAVMPFIAIWLQSIGVSSTMSGFILSAPQFAIVILSVMVGSWADRLSDWRSAIITCNLLVLALTFGLLGWQSPWGILILWTSSGLFMIASAPITDAAALNMTQRRGSDFARIRAVGSIGFVAGILVAGWIFDAFGMRWFLWILLVMAVLRVAAALALPHFKKQNDKEPIATADLLNEPQTKVEDGIANDIEVDIKKQPRSWFNNVLSGMTFFKQPGIFPVILGASLINASHSFQNIYSVLHWAELGISTTWASWLWAIGVIAEVALMWKFKSVARRISARHCLLFASLTCAFRWFLTGLNPGLGALIFLQSLHGITFGLTFLATVNFIARRVNPNHAAQAQSVLTTLTTFLMATGVWLSGHFYASLGSYSYWAMTGIALVGGGFVLSSYRTTLEDTKEPVATY